MKIYLKSFKTILILRACRLQTSKQYEELVDERQESKISKEAEIIVQVALLSNTMSEVVSMLEGRYVFLCRPGNRSLF